jgi:quercetin dioxygenase-like cupin family protein
MIGRSEVSHVDRRSFMQAVAALPAVSQSPATKSPAIGPEQVLAGQDRAGTHHGLGISVLDFKVSTRATEGGLFVVENTFHEKGGPARHRHLEQDEWFYALEGEFRFEIGDQRMTLRAGDSAFGPRRVPHVWACTGKGIGRILVVFTPAGKMEGFFERITKANAMPPQDPALWQEYGMELLGPPLAV